MKIRLGEMSIGDVLTDSFQLMFKNLPKYVIIYFMINFPILIIDFLQPIFMVKGSMTAVIIIPLLSFVLLGLLLTPLSTATILKMVSSNYLEEPISIGATFRFAFSRFWKLLGVLFLTGLVIIGGYCLLIVPGILFGIWYSFVTQVVIVENIGGGQALGRSKSLTQGFRWKIVGLVILVAIISLIAGGIATLFPIILPSYSLPLKEVYYLNLVITTLIRFSLQTVLTGIFGSIVMTLFYFEIRARKEGFDLMYLSGKSVPADQAEPLSAGTANIEPTKQTE